MILNYINLGMEINKAYILSEITKEDIEELDKDEDFQKDIEVTEIILEKDLLERHNTAMEIAVNKGNANAVQWKLEKINPDRWGTKKDETPIKGVLVVSKVDKELL